MSLMAKNVERLVVNCVLRYGDFDQCFNLYSSESNRTMPTIATADILDLFFDPEKEKDKKKIIKETRDRFRELFKNVRLLRRPQEHRPRKSCFQEKLTTSNQPFLDLMWHSHLPCFDTHTVSDRDHEYEMIKWCAWKGIEVPCSVIFAQIPTEKGICCAFNVDVADLYVDHELKRWIKRKQEEDRLDAFGGGYQKYGYELEDDWAPRQGRNNGLVLMVDAHSDKLAPALSGPHTVTRVHTNGTCTIRLSDNQCERINIRQLRPKCK